MEIPRVSFSNGKVSRCAVIRDDHLGCYYLDNAAMRRRVEIRRARGQDNELRSKGASTSYPLAPAPHLPPPSPPAVVASVALGAAGTSTKKRSLTSLVLRRPIVGPDGIWTVIHKSRTCILVHANQRDNQNRHELREPAPSRRNNSNDGVVNSTAFELNSHRGDLRVSVPAFLFCYDSYKWNGGSNLNY